MKSKSLHDSFNYAIDGIIYTIKTQRNMKVHVLISMLVLLLAMILNVSRSELLVLLLTIGFVLSAETFNTAIEELVNLVTPEYHPLARIVKNVSAGAVLVAAVISMGVGYIIFFERLITLDFSYLRTGIGIDDLTLLSILVVVGLAIVIKSRTGSINYLKGGMPSGHTAIAFSLATAIFYASDRDSLVTLLGFFLAALVAHTRVQGKIHNIVEVITGGLIGILVTVIVFQLRV